MLCKNTPDLRQARGPYILKIDMAARKPPTTTAFDNDDTPTLVGPSIGHSANREMLAIIGNYSLEAKAHGDKLQGLYESLRMFERPVAGAWGERLLEEQTRHHNADAGNLRQLEQVVGRLAVG